MCVTCTFQGLEQGAAAGSASGAVGLLAAGLSFAGLRGAANRLLTVDTRLVGAGAGALALAVVVLVMTLRPL
jgi:hypothetical protein